MPAFNEETLPRNLNVRDFQTGRDLSWFPLVVSASSGFGVDFAVWRGTVPGQAATDGGRGGPLGWSVGYDLVAVRRLNTVRTNDLTQSRENG